jgi:Fe-S-cluster containining protein
VSETQCINGHYQFGVSRLDINFGCTQCGKCCRDIKIPLTVAEAMNWLKRGHPVQLLCEASPWPRDLADDDPRAVHFKRRSFPVMSGSMPTRVVVTLVANGTGSCPNLLADMRCGIYEDRPLVCRIYPAEINPLVRLKPEAKSCPPEAWAANQPVFQRNGAIISEAIRQDIQRSQDTDALDVEVKHRLCAALSVTDAALVHEAVLVYSPGIEILSSALTFAMERQPNAPVQWRFVSDNAETIEGLENQGSVALHLRDAATLSYQLLGFQREALFGPYFSRGVTTPLL